ncbi:GNAT family N-acetyltransferase [Actinomadura flavalba]|uniref:GNAT family N-acetyltransferase n=1 Tax=Actinomadura flavalba TaxID=1120938 RepID=UPI00036AB0B1|nr:GNAT family N-acetyltransferase [Actinomadura flavalba]
MRIGNGVAAPSAPTYDRRMDDDAVRAAEEDDLAVLPGIERSADALFAPLGITFPPGPLVIEELIGTGARILVAGRPPAGFAGTVPLDGGVHLEQIAVHADAIRRGTGTRLLRAVVAEAERSGAARVSLLTFRDVPWNAPWYARHGFAELPQAQWGAGLRAHWAAEVAAGLGDLGRRVVMARACR